MTHNEYTNFLLGILIGSAIGLSVGIIMYFCKDMVLKTYCPDCGRYYSNAEYCKYCGTELRLRGDNE